MADQIILGISGSLRADSHNTALLRAAASMLPAEITLQITDLSTLPLYNEDLISADVPAAVLDLRKAVQEANALLIACPEYNYGMTGVLKNALDWCATNTLGNFIANKLVAIMGASRSIFGTARSQLQLRQTLHAANAAVLRKPEVYVRQAQNKRGEDGGFQDERTLEKVRELVDALVSEMRAGE